MKQLLTLAGAVGLLVVAWIVVGEGAGRARRDGAGEVEPSRERLTVPRVNRADPSAAIRAAEQLWDVKARPYSPREIVELLRVLDESLDDVRWEAVSPQVFFAWEAIRKVPEAGLAMGPWEATLLTRLVESGGPYSVEGLHRLAKAGGQEGSKIDGFLRAVASRPLTLERYDECRISHLVRAAVRVGDIGKASVYLARFAGDPKAAAMEPAKTAARVASAVGLAVDARSGKADLARVVEEWIAAPGVLDKGPALETILLALEGVGKAAIAGDLPLAKGVTVDSLVAGSTAIEGSARYWQIVMDRILNEADETVIVKATRAAPLLGIFEREFKKPGFEGDTWFTLAEKTPREAVRDLAQAVEFYRKSALTAQGDERILKAARKLVPLYVRMQEYQRGRQTLEEVKTRLSEEASREEAAGLIRDLARKVDLDMARVAQEKVVVEQDRLRGELAFMRGELARARRDGRAAEDVRSIENAVKRLEEQVRE